MAPDIQAILFDKDGTLLDFNGTWLPPYREAVQYVASLSSDGVDPDQLLAEGGFIAQSNSWVADSLLAAGSNRQILQSWSAAISRDFSDQEVDELRAIFRRVKDSYVPVIDPLSQPLEQLVEQGYRLGIATMDDAAQAQTMAATTGIEHLVEFICGADSGYGVKPEPGMVQAFAEQLGISCANVAMVGDSPRDIHMGVNAGAGVSIGVLTGAHDREELLRHTPFILDNIDQLSSFLLQLEG